MEYQENIIALRNKDKNLAYQAFADLMKKTEKIMNDKARSNPTLYRSYTPSELEQCSVDNIRLACSGTPFDPDKVELVPRQKFPDIESNVYYGIEVKQTKSNSWVSTGSSIVETTRVKTVEDLYMLFGKLGGAVPEFKCRPYQDVLRDIAVTHSPRYIIDMDLKDSETIFSKMKTDYDTFRNSKDPICQVRQYYRDKAHKKKKNEMPWWITSENVEQSHSFNIKLWNSLDHKEKEDLLVKCMILFPEALNPKRSMTKYNNTTLWLCSYCQVLNPNVRDLYSAGGKITKVNGELLESPVPQVFKTIVSNANTIKEKLTSPTEELSKMIDEYKPEWHLESNDLYEEWIKFFCNLASNYGVPLREWIDQNASLM